MKRLKFLPVLAILTCLPCAPALFAQGTAFTYQGQLKDNNSPANGTYDLLLGVYNDANVGFLIGATWRR